MKLTPNIIHHRMIEWRNLKNLHANARTRIIAQDKIIKAQALRIGILESTVVEQARVIQTLQLQIAELREMVFGRKKKSTDTPTEGEEPHPARRPRTRASYHRLIPKDDEVTETKPHPIDQCVACGTHLKKKTTRIYYEEDIPIVRKVVVKYVVERGWCNSCRQWRNASPLPSTPVILGENVRVMIAQLSTVSRLTYEQIRNLLHTTYQLSLSDGELAKILAKEADHLRPEYERLKARIRGEPAAHYDETSHPVQTGSQGNYAWVMASALTPEAVFVCGRSRGKGVAFELKGDANHIGVTDDYNAYYHTFSEHQLCWAHPYRKLRDLATAEVLSEEVRAHCALVFRAFRDLYRELRAALTEPFDITLRKQERSTFLVQLNTIAVLHPLDPSKLRAVKIRLQYNREKYFTCLMHEGVPADNNKAERSLRHLVLKRKVSFGSKTTRGAETTSILSSVLLSLFWSKPRDFFASYKELRGV